MIVNVDNVQRCWEYYECYVDAFYKEHYRNVTCKDFVEWCEGNLAKCPNCGEIVSNKEISLDNYNTDGVCDGCVGNGYYE